MDARFAAADGRLEAVINRFDRLEIQYHMLLAGLHQVEERLAGVEARLPPAG
jgi:hypothetical protein